MSRINLAIDGGSPVRDRFLPFGVPDIGDEEIEELIDTIRSCWIGTGPKTERFERDFEAYTGARHAIAVSSCTAALHLALLVNGIGPGDEVITSTMTFAATANTIVHVGATPVFADIDPVTLNISLSDVQRKITQRTRGVIPVHFAGLAVDATALDAITAASSLAVIEDCAHALGAKRAGRMIGDGANISCFSFYPNKTITTGEGGMITTNCEELVEPLRVHRLHGLSQDAWRRFSSQELLYSEVLAAGFKYNMTDLQASLGIHQLRKLDRFLEVRERYAARYDQAFRMRDGVRLQPRPPIGGPDRHGLHLYLLLLDLDQFRVDRAQIVRALRAENIGACIHYQALHLHPYYRDNFGGRSGQFPVAEEVTDCVLTLPLSASMTQSDAESVVEATERVLTAYRR